MDELITKHSTIMDKYDLEKRVGLIVDEWGSWLAVEPGTNPGFLYQQNTDNFRFFRSVLPQNRPSHRTSHLNARTSCRRRLRSSMRRDRMRTSCSSILGSYMVLIPLRPRGRRRVRGLNSCGGGDAPPLSFSPSCSLRFHLLWFVFFLSFFPRSCTRSFSFSLFRLLGNLLCA